MEENRSMMAHHINRNTKVAEKGKEIGLNTNQSPNAFAISMAVSNSKGVHLQTETRL